MTSGPVPTELPVVAAWDLPGAPGWPHPQPLEPDDWRHLLTACGQHRLEGRLAAAAESGRLPLTDAQADDVEQLHRGAMVMCVALERQLLDVTDLLADAGIPARVLKGPAYAHLDEADPAVRVFGDVDLLVRPETWDAAADLLVDAGYRRRFHDPRPGFTRRFGKGSSFTAPNGLEVDLHRTWVMGPYGFMVDLDGVWATSEAFEVAGQPLEALDAEHRLLHACFHAALGDIEPRWVALRDVAGMLLRTDHPVDAAAVVDRARAWGADAVVARAVSQAWDRLRLDVDHPPVDWSRAHVASARDQRALATYLDPELGYAARQVAAIRAIPRWSDRAAFVWALAVPSAQYRQERYGSAWSRLRAGAADALRWGRRSTRRSART